MAKKKDVKTLLPVIIVAGMAILALLMALFLDGATKTVVTTGVISTTTTVSVISLKGIIFGGGPNVITINDGDPSTLTYEGGVSTCGLIAFILVIIGILAVASSIFLTDKKYEKIGSLAYLIGSGLVALSGLLMFLLLTGGSTVVTAIVGNVQQTTPFVEYFEGFKLAAGPIIFAILAILGGGFGVANHFLKIIK